jgi:arylsulfatase A-like enzyme
MAARKPVSRRSLLAAGGAVAAVAALGSHSGAAAAKPRDRPNILWLVSEDNCPLIGAYGDPVARTPAIDALAAAGVLYANAFANAPVCAPTRFAIITGMRPESAGPAQHMRAEGRIPAFLQGFPKYLRDAGYYCTNNGKTDYNAALDMKAMWNESSERAHWRNRPEGAPFFAVFNFMTTHESRMFRQTEGRVRPQDVRVPAYLPDTPEVRRDAASYYNLMERMDGEVAAHLAALEAAGLADDTIVFYYSDNGGVMPRSKRYCYEAGMRIALVVRVPAKWAHLAPASAGSVIESPVSLLDLAPTVLSMAGISPPSYMQGVSLVNARRAKRRRYVFGGRDRMDERYDFVRTVRDERYRFIRNYAPHRIYGQYVAFEWQMDSYRALESAHRAGALNAVQERFFGEKPAEELYDVVADPDQVENLIDVPAHRKRIARMREALNAHMLEVNDNGFIPESSPIEGYDASRAPGAYPLKRVLALADKAIRRDSRNVAEFVRLLDDANEMIRYWSAQGLLMLREGAAPARARLDALLQTDGSTPVRIVAAESLALLGSIDAYGIEATRRGTARVETAGGEAPRIDAPVRYLGELLQSPANARLRLQALNALTCIGEPARQVLPAIEQAIRDDDIYVRQAARYLVLVLNGTYTPASQIYSGLAARES